jgi:predicted nucleic acid-binding Zn finger protein
VSPSLLVDADLRIVGGACSCNWYSQHKLTRGPCEHMLALRLAHDRAAFSTHVSPDVQSHKG